jgi:DNA-binding NarL/FixJ family response regulator
MTNSLFRVVLFDDHCLFVESLALALRLTGRFEIVGTAHDVGSAQTLVEAVTADLILSDVEIPGCSPFELLARWRHHGVGPRLAILSAYCTDLLIEQALRARVDGYLLKTEPFGELEQQLLRLCAGERVFSRAVNALLERDVPGGGDRLRSPTGLAELTPLQLGILKELARGCSVKEVARMLQLSVKSVDSHKYRLMKCLDIHDRVHLADFARRAGLLGAAGDDAACHRQVAG